MSDFPLEVKINGILSKVTVTGTSFRYQQGETETELEYRDIIGFHSSPDAEKADTVSRKLYYIHSTQKGNKLEKKALHISGNKNEMEQLHDVIRENSKKVTGRPKTVVVFLNPIGGSANAQSIYRNDMEPILKMADITCELIVSEKADHFKEVVKSFDFSPYDALVAIGGDGTFNEIICGLIHRKQIESGVNCDDNTTQLNAIDIPIAIIPAGTGNGLAGLAHGCIDVTTSTLHLLKGQTKDFPVFGNFCNNSLIGYSLMQTGYGMFGDLMYNINFYRWMRKFRYVFVPLWFFLFKTVRQFDAEVTYEILQDDVTKSLDEVSATKTVTEMTTITSTLALISSRGLFVDCFFEEIESKDYAVVLTHKPTRVHKLLSSFIKMRSMSSKAEIDSLGCVSILPITSMTVKVPKSESAMDLLVNLDGEILKLSHPEICIKFMPRTYKMFTSFERKEASKEQRN